MTRPHNEDYVKYKCGISNLFIALESSSSGKTSGQNLKVLYKINIATDTHHIIKNLTILIKR
jgi:hypothetical protein